MELDFLSPVSEELIAYAKNLSQHSIGAKAKFNSVLNGIPDLSDVQIAIIGIRENRLAESYEDSLLNFDGIRKAFYGLFPGNWHLNIADLGDIQQGDTVKDTYFAVEKTVAALVKMEVIPVILGGSQDLIYAQYRAYDTLDEMVNLVNVDARFDLGDAEQVISNKSYVSKIIVNEPYNLFNYSNIGYQTYFNSQEEIELMDRLFFDAYRLGEISNDISLIEPIMRAANLVSIDINSIEAGSLGSSVFKSPNGFNGKEICAISRYAGLSDKVSSFGVFEYNSALGELSNMLLAQMIWYFAEGVNYRNNENTVAAKQEFVKYQVPVDDDVLVFFKSPLSGRW